VASTSMQVWSSICNHLNDMKKNFLHIFIYIVATGIYTACSDSWDDKYTQEVFDMSVAPSLRVDQEKLEFPDTASKKTLEISANCRWTATSSASWLKLSSIRGKGKAILTVSVDAYNTIKQNRSAFITVSNGITTQKVSVTQMAMKESLRVSHNTMAYSFVGGSDNITVSTNVPWTVSSSSAAWLNVKKNDNGSSVKVTVQQNIATQQREAKITIKGVDQSKTITVTQSGVQSPKVTVSVTSKDKHEATCKIYASSPDINIWECGICYSNDKNQRLIKDNTNVSCQGKGFKDKEVTHTFELKYLKSNTTYYVCPYIVTAIGTQYGNPIQFTTLPSVPNEDDNGVPTIK